MVEGEETDRPFVTIGVPTYNRHDLLRQTLQSILAQSFSDFEVIVGNDYTAEVLTGEMLGISDPRIRFVNHPNNLREVGNMNALLGMATGRYFTWLFDDDLYQPDFLQIASAALEEASFPPALFPSYRILRGQDPFVPEEVKPGTISLVTSGRDFLRKYFTNRIRIISTCGLFDTVELKRTVGGVEELCASTIGLYCEYLFLVKCALLEKIVYLDAPFVVFRAHHGSWGESNVELPKYLVAGEQLIRQSSEVLRQPALRDDYEQNLYWVSKIHLETFSYKSAKLETDAENFGPAAIIRAISRVTGEIARIRKICATEGGGNVIRQQFRLFRLGVNSIYLVFFSFYFYSGKRRKDRSNTR